MLSSAIVVFHCCVGQHTLLMLEKKSRNKNVYYRPGNKISFRVNEDKRRITGEILEFRDSTIVFRGFEVPVSEISSLYIDEKTKWWLRYKVQQLSLLAGGGYLLLDVINNGELSENTLMISGTLIGVGVVAKILIGNRIKIRGRTKLRIIRI